MPPPSSPTARRCRARPAGPGVYYVQIQTPLQAADAKNHTTAMRQAIGTVPGVKTYLTGFPALAHDEQPIYSKDLSKGEMIAVPIAIAVLLFMFGTLGAVIVPLIFVARDPADDARAGVGDRPLRQHRPVRHQHRHPDRARDRDRLLDAGRVPLPRGAEQRQGRPGRAGDDHVHRRPGDAVLRA